MKVGDQERDVISLDRFPPQDVKRLCSLGQEAGELVNQYMLNLICLLDLDAYPHAIDAGLDIDALVLVARYGQRVQDDFGGARGFDLRHVVPLRGLGGEVGQREGGREGGPDALQVRAQGLGLSGVSTVAGEQESVYGALGMSVARGGSTMAARMGRAEQPAQKSGKLSNQGDWQV
jgi:hypothetical protein